MSDATRKEGQYWVLPKPALMVQAPVWEIWHWSTSRQTWLHPTLGTQRLSIELVAIDEHRLERTAMGADFYRPVFDQINSWMATQKDDPRNISISLAEDGIHVGITLHIDASGTKVVNVFIGTVQTFEELQTIWKCLPTR